VENPIDVNNDYTFEDDDYNPKTCHNGGSWNEEASRCKCTGDWTGNFCQSRGCPHRYCSGRGVCIDDTCLCQLPYTGKNCTQVIHSAEQRTEERNHRIDSVILIAVVIGASLTLLVGLVLLSLKMSRFVAKIKVKISKQPFKTLTSLLALGGHAHSNSHETSREIPEANADEEEPFAL